MPYKFTRPQLDERVNYLYGKLINLKQSTKNGDEIRGN